MNRNEELILAIRDYIDFVNHQANVYMDAMAGFAGHRVRVERQVFRVTRPTGQRFDEAGRRAVVCTSYEDPSRPGPILNRIVRADDYISANSDDGFNAQQLGQAILVFLYAYWEHAIRRRLAKLVEVDVHGIESATMGDIRLLRNAILHSKGIIGRHDHSKLRVMGDTFAADRKVDLSYANMHRVFVLIKQDCARHLSRWTDVPIDAETIVDLAIQTRPSPASRGKGP